MISLAIERRFVAWTLAWTVVSLLAFGIVSAIIPNPVFGRQLPAEPFAIAVWLLTAPLLGLVGATYTQPPGVAVPPLRTLAPADEIADRRSSTIGALAGLGAFLAIGCPVCNKLVLLALGTSGALTLWAPLQPIVGTASLFLLVATAAWRLRIRRRGGTCAT